MLKFKSQKIGFEEERMTMRHERKTVSLEAVRGMKILDRGLFLKSMKVLGMTVPLKNITAVAKFFKDRLLQIPQMRSIAEIASANSVCDTHKLLLFNPEKLNSACSLSTDDKAFLNSNEVEICSESLYDITLTYENFTYDQVLSAVLPVGENSIGGFSIIGHIAHLNLRDELLEYKTVIGK